MNCKYEQRDPYTNEFDCELEMPMECDNCPIHLAQREAEEYRSYVRLIARMDTEEDFEKRGEQMCMEDAFQTVNELIETARNMLHRQEWDDSFTPDMLTKISGIKVPPKQAE